MKFVDDDDDDLHQITKQEINSTKNATTNICTKVFERSGYSHTYTVHQWYS